MLLSSLRIRGLIDHLQKSIFNSILAMDSDSVKIHELEVLFTRLENARRQADLLKSEVININKEILKYQNLSCFKRIKFLNDEENDLTANKRAKYDFPTRDGYVVVYTDGACENNGTAGAKAGIGVWFADNHPLNLSKPVNGKATNNVAEIQACINAVKIARNNAIDKLKIATDSQFTINCMTKWITGWKRKGWKLSDGKSEVKNKTDLQELDKLCQGIDVKWEHVAGHSGIKGNEEADKLAREGAKFYKK